MTTQKDLTIVQGSTYHQVIRWETSKWATAAIASMTLAGIVQVETVTPHGIPDGWRAAVVDAKGLTDLNAKENPPADDDMRLATVVSPTAIEFNPISSAAFRPYTQGGWLKWRVPQDLTGYTARMAIKDRVGGNVLLSLDTTNARIVIDPAEDTIELVIDSATTQEIDWAKGVYDLEMVSADGRVETLMRGTVRVTKEITT